MPFLLDDEPFTKVPNVFLDKHLATLEDTELKCLLYIVRRTLGFNKTTDKISISQFVHGVAAADGRRLDKGTGLSRRGVLYALKALEVKGLINVDHSRNHVDGNSYTVNLAGAGSADIAPVGSAIVAPGVVQRMRRGSATVAPTKESIQKKEGKKEPLSETQSVSAESNEVPEPASLKEATPEDVVTPTDTAPASTDASTSVKGQTPELNIDIDVAGESARLAELLLSLLAELNPLRDDLDGAKRKKKLAKFGTDMSRLLRINKQTAEKIEAVIKWAQADNYWQGCEKIRDHWNSITAQMQKEVKNGQGLFGKFGEGQIAETGGDQTKGKYAGRAIIASVD